MSAGENVATMAGPSTIPAQLLHVERSPRRGCGRGRLGQYRSPRTTVEQALRTERLFKHVRIVPGWFHQTLPPAGLRSIGFLRLDGDTYNGTFEALRRLYPLVVLNGVVYVDDAGAFKGAALAVRDYFGRSIGTPIREAEGYFDAVWFVKDASLRAPDALGAAPARA